MTDKVLTPNNPEDLMEFLRTEESVKSAFGGGPEAAQKFIVDYAAAAHQADPAVEEQRRENVATELRSILEEKGFTQQSGRPPMSDETAKGPGAPMPRSGGFRKAHDVNPKAAGNYDEPWESFGSWAAELHNYYRTGQKGRIKDMSESVLGDGGALVPEEFRAEVMRLSLEAAVVRPRATVIPMGGATLRIPAIRDTSHASNVFGGISGSWVNEAGTVSSSTNQPSFGQVVITPYKLTAYTVASNELLADGAVGIEALIGQLFPQAISYFEDDSFINGTGAGQPQGIINAAALVTQAKETGQAATTIEYQNLVKMYSRMLPQSLARAVWVAHPDTFPQLAQMSLEVGTGGSAVWVVNASQAAPMSIFGRPLIFSEKCQTVGTAGDIYFADFSQYLIGDRQALTVSRSEHVNFTTDEQVWKFVQRVDGRPWLTSALTPRNGSTTISPFVNLATRS